MILLVATKLQADQILTGEVVRIIDGDTLVLLENSKNQKRIRLAGIDTPERKQPFGKMSKRHLTQLTAGKTVLANCPKIDHYGRHICKVEVDSIDVGLNLIRHGLAWHYKKYAHEQSPSDRKKYANIEELARKEKVGIWSTPSPTPPWEWRHR